jgi:hypothetical protein
VDNHARKRREQIAEVLAAGYMYIRVMLMNLDGIGMAPHSGPDARDRIAEDLMMVRNDVLPTVDKPDELLSVIGGMLLDWVVTNDLVTLASLTGGGSPRQLDTMEDMASRFIAHQEVLEQLAPELFREE